MEKNDTNDGASYKVHPTSLAQTVFSYNKGQKTFQIEPIPRTTYENVNKAKANEGGEEKNSNDKGAKKGAKRSTSSFSSKPAPKRRKANPKNKV